jgi:hypothetical protein
MSNRKRVWFFEGYTLKDLLKNLDWKGGIDFDKTLTLPMIVSGIHPYCKKSFQRVFVTIEKVGRNEKTNPRRNTRQKPKSH